MFLPYLHEAEDKYWPLALRDFYERYAALALPRLVLGLPRPIPNKMPYALGVSRVARCACEMSATYEPSFAQMALALERGEPCELPVWVALKDGEDSMTHALSTIERSTRGCSNLLIELAVLRGARQGGGVHNLFFAVCVLLGEEYV